MLGLDSPPSGGIFGRVNAIQRFNAPWFFGVLYAITNLSVDLETNSRDSKVFYDVAT